MKATSTKEDFLIWLLKHDSQWAFDNLYKMYAHRLFAFAMEYCHHNETAEEIVEDTFIWIWNHRHAIKQEKTLFNLVFIKARHLLINAYRATLNSPRFEDYVDYANTLGTDEQGSQMEYDEFLRIIRKGLDWLPPTQRRVIELVRFEQKSVKEVAILLDMKDQSVRNQLSLGLKRLMAFIGRSGYGVFSVLLLFLNKA
ncbi:sigma-70 family RNA polymerase sigma factor [Prevotella sp. A2931]|uniref:Sigma-70 family RNA polymerase sigma factor n=1 Tax=Prevotella illustrans TaxID=2800387 RepID=A0ABS3M708_9BACT|nr:MULTISPECIES: sigma-70 family RNA polymerase sigma factor [Prevotella]MBO1363968.1 sigma-70 family RNA polymerase sigma factor [Prevotella illustrans]PTL26015.1 RNA polymerase sigma-70 factor [Prevotella sp. oral taxon 820]